MEKLTTFYFLIFSHLIADFILQPSSIAKNKFGFNKNMLAHSLIMAVAFLIPLFNYLLAKTLTGGIIIFITHIFIDNLKVGLGKILKLSPEKHLYWAAIGIDQILHLTVIYLNFILLIN